MVILFSLSLIGGKDIIMEKTYIKEFESFTGFVDYHIKPASWAHTEREQWWFEFSNGLSASVVRGSTTLGGRKGLFEFAVMLFDSCYGGTPISSDGVVGYLTEEEVLKLLDRTSKLVDDPNAIGFTDPA